MLKQLDLLFTNSICIWWLKNLLGEVILLNKFHGKHKSDYLVFNDQLTHYKETKTSH